LQRLRYRCEFQPVDTPEGGGGLVYFGLQGGEGRDVVLGRRLVAAFGEGGEMGVGEVVRLEYVFGVARIISLCDIAASTRSW
jgi:hypothetical protein